MIRLAVSVPSTALACALAALLALPAQAQPASSEVATLSASAKDARLKAGEAVVRAKVVEVDYANRTTTLRGPKGELLTVHVPADVKNFEQMRVGDELVLRYAVAVAARLEHVSHSGIRERVESSSLAGAPAGALPGVAAARTIEVLGEIRALDPKTGTIRLRGATRTFKLAVPADLDISKLKVGDEVRAVFTEAVAVNIERPAAK
jgi:Cu/Ag efflux protein CusF